MEDKTLAAFIEYVKEKFGYDITLKPSLTPDSFKSIFGESFTVYSDSDPLF